MRLTRLIILGCCFLMSKARLLKEIPENAETSRDQQLHRIIDSQQRAPRQIHIKPNWTSFGLEENGKPNKIGPIFVYNDKLRPSTQRRILVRDPRHSKQHEEKNVMTQSVDKEHDENNQVLIKAPIPKFYELDYEDDYQKHLERISVRHVVDSGSEREDEDFNVDDYEFDVNHDEFVGQGKPKEPKVKVLDNVLISDLVRKQEENVQETTKPVTERKVVTIRPRMRHLTYKPGQQTEVDEEDVTKPTTKDVDDEKYGDTGAGDHYDKVVNNGKFTIFGGSPKYSLLLVPWW